MTIVANDLRTRGIQAIRTVLKSSNEAYISVRGKKEFVVLRAEDYDRLRMYELDAAYLQAKRDIERGDYTIQSADEHIRGLKNALQDS